MKAFSTVAARKLVFERLFEESMYRIDIIRKYLSPVKDQGCFLTALLTYITGDHFHLQTVLPWAWDLCDLSVTQR